MNDDGNPHGEDKIAAHRQLWAEYFCPEDENVIARQLRNGLKYTGLVKNGVPHGLGCIQAANGQCWTGKFDRGVLINNKAITRGQYGTLIAVYKTSQEIVESQDAVAAQSAAAQSAAARARAAEEKEAPRQELTGSRTLDTIFIQSRVNLSNIPVTNTKGAIQENCSPINTDKPKNKSRHKQTCFERFSLCWRGRSSAKVAARG